LIRKTRLHLSSTSSFKRNGKTFFNLLCNLVIQACCIIIFTSKLASVKESNQQPNRDIPLTAGLASFGLRFAFQAANASGQANFQQLHLLLEFQYHSLSET
jgi:hypothetical protein